MIGRSVVVRLNEVVTLVLGRTRFVLPRGLMQHPCANSIGCTRRLDAAHPSFVAGGVCCAAARWDSLSAGPRPRLQPPAQRCGRPLKRCRAKKRRLHLHIGTPDHTHSASSFRGRGSAILAHQTSWSLTAAQSFVEIVLNQESTLAFCRWSSMLTHPGRMVSARNTEG